MSEKPTTRQAMQKMLTEIRRNIPFDTPQAVMCADSNSCQGCSVKLLEFLAMETDNWQQKLDDGVVPDFRDLAKLEKTARAVYRTLQRNGLIPLQDSSGIS